MFLTALRDSIASTKRRLPSLRLYFVSTSSMMLGVGAQAIGFILLARFLGKNQFGQLATISAAMNLGSAWVQLGSAELMRRRVGRNNSEYAIVLGHSVVLIFVWGSIVALVLSVILSFIFVITDSYVYNFTIILFFAFSILVCFPWISLTEQIFLTRKKFLFANVVNAGFGIARALTTIVACLVFNVQSLPLWSIWNFGVYFAGALVCGLAISSYGAPRVRILRREIPVGITFGISGFLSAVRQNVDLLALSVVASPATVGTYGVARRMISVAVVTGASLDRLVYSRLAIAGQRGPEHTFRLARRYVLYSVILTGVTSIGLYFVISPLVPIVFGLRFLDAIAVLKILCWTLILIGVQYIAFDALNAADLHRKQIVISSGASLVGSLTIAMLTLTDGIAGTYVGVYISELLLAVSLWSGLIYYSGLSERITNSASKSL